MLVHKENRKLRFIKIIEKFLIFNFSILLSQDSFNSSNPIENLLSEKEFSGSLIRPILRKKGISLNNISFSIDNFFNSGFTNLDNNGSIIAYPGNSTYLSFNYRLFNKFLYIKFNPTQELIRSNQINNLTRGNFQYLNDKYSSGKNKISLGQSTFSLHVKNIAIGISSENMWVGPGFHSSLSMSNNAPGFEHYYIGTLRQIKFSNYGLNFRYMISERKNQESTFFHTSLASSITIYNKPTITLGFNRVYLSGGIDQIMWSIEDASKIVFEPLFGSNKKNSSDYSDLYGVQPDYWDPWDQLLVGYINAHFPENNAHLYLEIGTDDSRANMIDLKAHWDHSIGYILGFKKYGIFDNESLFFGIEMMSNKTTSNTLNPKFYRGDWNGRNFYDRDIYLYSSYEGRRWGAHSGSDSDDKIVLFGYSKNSDVILATFNIERHGIVSQSFPEFKRECTFLIQKKLNNILYSVFIEKEHVMNYNFEKRKKAEISNILGFSINYSI